MRDGCAVRSKLRGEALHGTASRARRWVLYEQPGAWGADVLSDRTLPPRIAAQLTFLAGSTPARVLLVRRAPGVPREVPNHALFVGVTTPAGGWFERFDLHGPEDLFDVDLEPLAEEGSCGGAPVSEPFYLVCTNGKHDACCAEYGRPVVDALAPRLGERLWECSHVGGDRFAGNLVCLPAGVFYGHLDATVASAVVRAHEDGQVDLDRWRGRSSLPFPVQSAELFARRELGLTGESDLRYVTSRRSGNTTEAQFALPHGGHVRVSVRRRLGEDEHQLTCKGTPVLPPVHDLLDLVVS